MSWIRYAIATGILVATLWAQSPAPPAANSGAPEPPAAQAKPQDASGNAAVPPAATPPPDSTVLIITKKVKPDYPTAALPDKLQGQVIVRVVVDEDGGVESTQVVSGNAVLAQAAVDAAKQWKFKPFIRNGQPVKAAIKMPFDFAPPADTPPDAPAKPPDANTAPAKTGAPAQSRPAELECLQP